MRHFLQNMISLYFPFSTANISHVIVTLMSFAWLLAGPVLFHCQLLSSYGLLFWLYFSSISFLCRYFLFWLHLFFYIHFWDTKKRPTKDHEKSLEQAEDIYLQRRWHSMNEKYSERTLPNCLAMWMKAMYDYYYYWCW